MNTGIFKIAPILNDEDYERALSIIEPYFDNEEIDQETLAYLEIYILQIKDYENQHYKIGLPSVIDAIKSKMEERDLNVKDLAKILEINTNRVYEILNEKRKISLSLIKKLHERLNIPANILLQ